VRDFSHGYNSMIPDTTSNGSSSTASGAAARAGVLFFPVSLVKLTVMSLCTLGLYSAYWVYKNWDWLKKQNGLDISPFWRMFFGYFFCYSLFEKIRSEGEERGILGSVAAGPLAAGWIIFNLMVWIPDPYWLVTFASFLFLLPVQSYINAMNAAADPSYDRNSRLRGWNILAVVVGGPFFVMGCVGAFLPPE
jgi:hypothetical protein